MKSYDFLLYILANILGLVGTFTIGIGVGYAWGTYKVNNCKTMSPSESFKNKECREFYLGK